MREPEGRLWRAGLAGEIFGGGDAASAALGHGGEFFKGGAGFIEAGGAGAAAMPMADRVKDWMTDRPA